MDIKIRLYYFENLHSGGFKVSSLNDEKAIESMIDNSLTLKNFIKPIFLFQIRGSDNYQAIKDFLDKENSLLIFDNDCNIIHPDEFASRNIIKEGDTLHILFNSRELPPEIAQKLMKQSIIKNINNSIFISHGRSNDWREVQAYLEKILNYDTIELAQQPNKGRHVLQKLEEESNKCICAVIIMTGDDETNDGEIRARENVIHEIGYFQGKYGLDKVILLHERGVNMPSNIHGIVYIPFEKSLIRMTFGDLMNELRVIMRIKS